MEQSIHVPEAVKERFTAYAGLIGIGMQFEARQVFKPIAHHVKIAQKVVAYTSEFCWSSYPSCSTIHSMIRSSYVQNLTLGIASSLDRCRRSNVPTNNIIPGKRSN